MSDAAPNRLTIFISAVSDEFKAEREKIAAELRKKFIVREQSDFPHEPGTPTLLQKLHDYIRGCDAVIAIVGTKSGDRPPPIASTLFERMLPPDLDDPSYTQWEVIFATHVFAKFPMLFAQDEAFSKGRRARTASERSQKRFIRWIERSNLPRIGFQTPAELPELVLQTVNRQEWLRQDKPAIVLPYPIRDHLMKLQKFALKRMVDMSGKDIANVLEAGQYFAPRTAVDPETKEEFTLPGAILRSAERMRSHGDVFEEFLVVGGAGEGKTTLVHLVLCELTQPEHVDRFRLVPMFANCVTLNKLFGSDESKDAEALEEWLGLAVGPGWFDQQIPRADRAEIEQRIGDFVKALNEGNFRLILVIDGFDELDPSAALEGKRLIRLLTALHRWERKHELRECYRMATTRPSFENIGDLTGMKRVDLRPPGEREVKRLAKAFQVSGKALARFWEVFRNARGIESKLVYFHPLVRYFERYPAEAADPADRVSRLRLMNLEVEQAVEEIIREVKSAGLATPRQIEERKGHIRNLLVRIAIETLDRSDPERPLNLSREGITKLASRERLLAGVQPLVESDRVPSKILSVLIYAGTGGGETRPGEYRLPHNEYRDFLLADGLFRLILNRKPPQGDETAADLARAYRRAERVAGFLAEMRDQETESGGLTLTEFSQEIAGLMNSRLRNRESRERADSSPHGAMLTLLLSIGPLPTTPVLKTEGVNFHGAVARSNGSTRIQLPGNGNWSRAVLREADLRGASLCGAVLDHADLDNALLSGADLSGASLVGANLHNIAMGRYKEWPTVLSGAKFDDGEAGQSAADWFNYRFQGLKGYYCFFDMELARSGKYVLVAGSRGQLLVFDTDAEDWRPVCLQTAHTDDILDVSSHPTDDIIVTTCKDGTVRLHRLPHGSPADWPGQPAEGGRRVCPVQSIHLVEVPFAEGKYPRRARFSKSGHWLIVIARDHRVAFVRYSSGGSGEHRFSQPVFGIAHTGPVMSVDADVEGLTNLPPGTHPPDRFFTAGYDGRIAVWTESQRGNAQGEVWGNPLVAEPSATGVDLEEEIIRAVVADVPNQANGAVGLWAGAEKTCRLRYYRLGRKELVEDESLGTRFDSGVFSLALENSRRLLAAGLASGEVLIYQADGDGSFDWTRPRWRCPTGDDIVRAMKFVGDGGRLLVATWDGGLHLYALTGESGGAPLQPIRSFVYPASQWLPHRDTANIAMDRTVNFERSRGISKRMKEYLRALGRACVEAEKGEQDAR